jgi:hypothetical protein
MQKQTDTANGNNQAQNKNTGSQSPDPKKNSGLNSDQGTIVNEEEQDHVTNGSTAGTDQTEKEKSFHKNEMPDNDDSEADDGVPRIGDDPGEMERINPKM